MGGILWWIWRESMACGFQAAASVCWTIEGSMSDVRKILSLFHSCPDHFQNAGETLVRCQRLEAGIGFQTSVCKPKAE